MLKIKSLAEATKGGQLSLQVEFNMADKIVWMGI
jgi:hypothetical protein